MSGKELSIGLTLSVFRERLSVYVCASYPFRIDYAQRHVYGVHKLHSEIILKYQRLLGKIFVI